MALGGPLLFVERVVTPRYDPVLGACEWFLYAASTDACPEDVVCGEGRAMLFKTPAEALALDLTPRAAEFVPRFLASEACRRLTAPRGPAKGAAPPAT